ncbi:MAG: winged helix-turn-helix domain-containing protein [Rhizomicrobium sp.]
MGTVTALQPVDLAHVAAFRLGALTVDPATRQIARGDVHETLEPRVMQVLVALRQANGAVVSRNDLIALCWDGRVVGDNAIHRTISRLRDIAGGIGAECFRLETVAKVGYRLIACDVKEETATLPPAARGNHRVIAAAAIILLAVAAGALLWMLRPVSSPPLVAVIASSNTARDFAGGLTVDLARLASVHGNAVTFEAGTDGRRNTYQLAVATRVSHARGEADLTLRRASSPEIVWSASFEQPDGDLAALREQAANTASGTIDCALHALGDQTRSSGDQLRKLFAACETFGEDSNDAAVAAWQRAAVAAPGNAEVLAALAYTEATFDSSNVFDSGGDTTPGAKERLRAARASGEDPALAYAAQAMMISNSQFSTRLAIIDRGLARDPDCAILHGLKYEAWRNVGRIDNALDSAHRAVSLAPDSQQARQQLISGLFYAGFTQEARSELAHAERAWPNSSTVKYARARFELRYGDAASLLHQIEIGNALPNSPWNLQDGPERAFLLARVRPTPANIDALAALSARNTDAPTMSLQNLVGVGRVDQAYEFVNRPDVLRFMRAQTEILFRANMRAFVLDRRFMALAGRLGLVQYWSASNLWPDFCHDKDLPYDCRTEARRLHAGTI